MHVSMTIDGKVSRQLFDTYRVRRPHSTPLLVSWYSWSAAVCWSGNLTANETNYDYSWERWDALTGLRLLLLLLYLTTLSYTDLFV